MFERKAKINVITERCLTFFILTIINIKNLHRGERNDVKFALSRNGTFLY